MLLYHVSRHEKYVLHSPLSSVVVSEGRIFKKDHTNYEKFKLSKKTRQFRAFFCIL